ncbi:hypothetical protein [Clostridium sp. MD294]|uniref:hypothetical protein n=1 Tax=Clostridium sp. MD294 TaxID=97138 RepID=UPI0002CAF144|nr:hypothetical protein [Clostridium sp. MD294]USF29057.1 hypothetical protein C820_000440 [Clostridium sp. MD294]
MRKKHILLLFIFCSAFISFHTISYATTKVVEKAVYTDIVAYVNGKAIPSYNINGYTGIVAEDLEKYGFDVDYSEWLRQLVIEYNETKKITADYVPQKTNKTIGTFFKNIYQTDIITCFEGQKVPSYNIGGKTIILMDYLEYFGDVVWYPEERKICFDYVPDWRIDIKTEYDQNRTEVISSFTIELIKNKLGEFEISGENYQYLSNISMYGSKDGKTYLDLAIYQNVMEYTSELMALLNKMYTINIDNHVIAQNADFAKEHMQIYVDDEKMNIIDVQEGMGNGHQDYYFVMDNKIRSLDNVQTIKIICK